jgi:hypothetical protein
MIFLEKLTKQALLATIRTLVPRELYKYQDAYDAEVERIYSWSNMSENEMTEIYQTKLRSIDLGRRVKQHSSS